MSNQSEVAVNPTANPNSLLLSLATAAPISGLTVWQLRGLIANGELHVVRVGNRIYLHHATLAKWCERAQGKYRVQPHRRREKSGRAA